MQTFLIALLECSIAMSVIGLLYMAATPFLQNQFTAKGRYYAWLIIVIGLIIPFRFQFPTSVVSLEILLPVLENVGHTSLDQGITPSAATVAAIPWYVLAGGFWIGGVIVFLSYHAIRHKHFLHMMKRWGMECSDQQALRLLQDVQANMNITRKVDLRVYPGIASPMLVGFVRPIILLPSENISSNELLFILKHELIHLKRGDLGYKTLVLIAAALHWFNPFVYRMAREIALQCELSCDEEVIKHSDMSNRQQYVEAIIGLIKKQSREQSLLSTSFSDSRLDLKKRVISIMDTRSKKWGISLLMVIVLATIGTGVMLKLSPTKSETTTPDSTRSIPASGNIAIHEENKPVASQADPVASANNPEEDREGTALEPASAERKSSTSEASPTLEPEPAPEQNTGSPVAAPKSTSSSPGVVIPAPAPAEITGSPVVDSKSKPSVPGVVKPAPAPAPAVITDSPVIDPAVKSATEPGENKR
ncbi:peptidase M56 [Brevibacillus antibioticus]|uniref:Peptidase M56 n=1 Tax=Brevibacillus antibioticus TaxID=2570228 RepID=A0A4U2YCU7_9BACL|nr:M56 family metallopeptidase [Brevibacillus antibioticus]TKI58195.1 peptidase M56 [Brevibacillus antibioticus]